MAQAGPYRERLKDGEAVDEFWKALHRRRAWRRALPVIVGFLALSPAVAVAISAGAPPTSSTLTRREREIVGRSAADSWGVVISAAATRPWWGLSRAAPRPSLAESPYPSAQIQGAVLTAGPELQDCYLRSSAFPAKSQGELVASMLITKNGEVTAAVGGAPELRRAGVTSCVAGVLNRMSFPSLADYGWVHLPLRVEP
jgi:hypothetical protein